MSGRSELESIEEKKISFVIPVHGESGMFLPRCIHSILEQDYPNKDITVVFDGEDQFKGALRQREFFKDDDRIKFFIKKQGGAPAARNYGLDNSDGYYVCFFDCDSILRAGAIRSWVTAFDANQDCDFVYNGYRYTMKDKYQTGVLAKDFDPRLLTCNNYISTMNPIKRDKCPRWDESLEGLQDWHFWLQAVHLNGSKGVKIDDNLVVTEPPSEESLSGKTHKNHLEIYNKVREKIGIKKREWVIGTSGAEFQSMRRARILDADYHDFGLLMTKPNDYKAIISMGFYVETPATPGAIFFKANKDCKKIIHFIGTDVYQLSKASFGAVRQFAKNLPPFVDKILCNAPWLKEELGEMGLDAELVYCPLESEKLPFYEELPKDYTVAVYRSDTNPMYHEWFMIEAAKALPDIKFKFFGGEVPRSLNGVPKNVEYLGRVAEEDMPELIKSTNCIARISLHDGFPASVSEWIISGREALFNIEAMPETSFCDIQPREETIIQDKRTFIESIRKMQRDPKNLEDRKKSSKFYKELLSVEAYKSKMENIING
tara:strand:+ start:11142 stop:12776 length:1635 start_codon:yes stop_codon:yes gene_type:complete